MDQNSSQTQAATYDPKTYKWLFILQGIIFILFGWFILSNPVDTTLTLIRILGLFWIISGVVDMVRSFIGKTEHRGLTLIGGLIGIIAGMVVLNNAVLAGVVTTTFLVYFIAFAFLFNGIIKMFLGSKREGGEYKWSWGNLILGGLYAILGIAMLGAPLGVTLATIVLIVGWLAIINGIANIILPFMLKSEDFE